MKQDKKQTVGGHIRKKNVTLKSQLLFLSVQKNNYTVIKLL